ncbi:MAG: alanine--glyoxylate aminotransferase family protein, partial [Sulfobacillus sp.]|nr:alanine--glyoxylate aminotransferase family protein [Sulfobacillus sp.]
AAGLPPLVGENVTSPTVTALSVPAPLTPADLRRQAAERGLQIAGGLGPWHHSAIRIGHVGAVDAADLWGGLGILAHMVPNPLPALEAAFTAWKSPSPVFS